MTPDPELPDFPPHWPDPGPPIRLRHGRRGVPGAGYHWAAMIATPDHLPDDLALVIASRLGDLSGEIADLPREGWEVVRRTRRRVLAVRDEAGWRRHGA